MNNAKVYNDKRIIPTYELQQDDLNPIFDKHLDPYPYTLQNSRSKQKTNKEYDVVILENDYLKLTVVPSLGGRLFSAIDKRKNQEFLYCNTVVKPRMIGTRGGWFSGGIEYNFPISHSPTTMDRVNYSLHTYEDGSASVIFGNIEQVSYMNWKVELKLYPEKAYIEQNVKLSNPTARENRFYFWTNTAVEYNKSLRLIYPFDWGINHVDGKYIKWPYYKNIDHRDASQIAAAYETFGKLMMNDFFGVYNYEKDYGLIHYANRKKVKGAKFFTWGNDQNAEVWNKSLTDNDSQYIEIQSGPFESQAVYKFLKPHQSIEWNEYWYPVFETNGFKFAEKELALNYEFIQNGIQFTFSAVERLNGCKIVFRSGDKEQQAEKDLTPEKVEKVSFELDGNVNPHQFVLDVYCGDRHILNIGERDEFSHEYPDNNLYEDSRTSFSADDQNKTLKLAQHRESLGAPDEAIALYKKYLQEQPDCTTALNRLGGMYLKNRQLDLASQCFKKVLNIDNRNSRARFFLAATEKEQGNLQRARRLFMDIAADAEFYDASVIELIKLDIAFGYFKEAVSMIETFRFNDKYMSFLAGIAYRKDGRTHISEQIIGTISAHNEFTLAEKYLISGGEQDKEAFVRYTSGDERTLLPIVLDYIDMKLYDDAEQLLSLVSNPSVKSKLVTFQILRETNRFSEEMVNSIGQYGLEHIFVNESKIVQTISDLCEKDASGKLDYLLGVFYQSASRKDEALDSYLSAYRKGLRYTVLLRNIGYIYYKYNKDLANAATYFEQDVFENGGKNEDVLVQLDKIYKEQGELGKRQQLIPYMEGARNKPLVLLSLVEIYKDSGQEDKALHILENEEFENWEGQEVSGPCYRDLIIHMAMKALNAGNVQDAKQWIDRVDQYPPTLNYGDSARTALSDVYYYKGMVYANAGEEQQAVEFFKKGYMELDQDEIHKSEKSRKFSMQCLEQLQSRYTVS